MNSTYLSSDLVLRSSSALAEVRKTPPLAQPSADNCTFCSVRHLCDDYWVDENQELLADEKSDALVTKGGRLVDFEVEIREQESPSIWHAVTLHGHGLPVCSNVLLRIPEGDRMLHSLVREGRRLRLIGASLIANSNGENATPLIRLSRFSEVFLIESPTSI